MVLKKKKGWIFHPALLCFSPPAMWKGVLRLGSLRFLWLGLHVLFEQVQNFFLAFWNLEIGILAQTMEQDDRVQYLPANHAVPTKKYVVDIVKFLKNHLATASLAADFLFAYFFG
jgi:hypothetical protein